MGIKTFFFKALLFSLTILTAACGREGGEMVQESVLAYPGANMTPYEFGSWADSRAPGGYRLAYVSHYGRHGARTGEHREDYNHLVFTLENAKACGILSPDGERLLQDALQVVEAHKASNLTLTALGKEEQEQLANRFWSSRKAFLKASSKKIRAVSFVNIDKVKKVNKNHKDKVLYGTYASNRPWEKESRIHRL